MSILSYKDYLAENILTESAIKAVSKLEDVLNLPKNSGAIQNVIYDENKQILRIEYPNDLGPMDVGAIIASINNERVRIKKAYPHIQHVMMGDVQITINK